MNARCRIRFWVGLRCDSDDNIDGDGDGGSDGDGDFDEVVALHQKMTFCRLDESSSKYSE